ncbi:hypothetical protein R6Q57_024311 [Mikania cordata]
MSKQQRKTVKSMGFKLFLSLDIETIPSRFAQWLASNYDGDMNELNEGTHFIHITSHTVKDVLGIPLGRLTVNEKNKPRMSSSNTLRIWKCQYPKKSRITVKDVIEEITKFENGVEHEELDKDENDESDAHESDADETMQGDEDDSEDTVKAGESADANTKVQQMFNNYS